MSESMGTIIMRLRKGRGLTQEQLASALGISFQAVSKWENDLSCPDLSTLPLLADIFSVSIDTLFGRTAEARPVPTAVDATEERAAGFPFPWPNDDTFYAVLFHGHELIGFEEGKGYPQKQKAFQFQYEGPAQNIVCAFDLQIEGDVRGSVNAGGDVNCGAVGGGVEAGGDVSCDAVGGAVTAGGDVTCDAVYGPLSAAGDVTCDDVYGNIDAGGDVTADDVTGNVSAGGDLTCDTVQGGASAGGEVNIDGLDRLGDELSEKLSGLGETISDAVRKSMKKPWRFRELWPFGDGEVNVDITIDDDEE